MCNFLNSPGILISDRSTTSFDLRIPYSYFSFIHWIEFRPLPSKRFPSARRLIFWTGPSLIIQPNVAAMLLDFFLLIFVSSCIQFRFSVPQPTPLHLLHVYKSLELPQSCSPFLSCLYIVMYSKSWLATYFTNALAQLSPPSFAISPFKGPFHTYYAKRAFYSYTLIVIGMLKSSSPMQIWNYTYNLGKENEKRR